MKNIKRSHQTGHKQWVDIIGPSRPTGHGTHCYPDYRTVHWTCCRGFKMHQLVWYASLSVQYKLCTPMYTIHHGLSPVYLSEQVNTVAAQTLRRGLRYASTTNYTIPRLLTKFGERAFSFAGPTAWNSLPHELRAAPTLNSFKRRLKTHLFNTAFNR